MSANRIEWQGLAELRAALRQLPADLAADAGPIVLSHAHDAEHAVAAVYHTHEVTGTLARRLSVTEQAVGRFGAAAIVASRAPHAWWFEHGTQARHTVGGAERGAAPPHPTFIPAVIRARRAMYDTLKGLLERAGFQVSGDA